MLRCNITQCYDIYKIDLLEKWIYQIDFFSWLFKNCESFKLLNDNSSDVIINKFHCIINYIFPILYWIYYSLFLLNLNGTVNSYCLSNNLIVYTTEIWNVFINNNIVLPFPKILYYSKKP